MFGVNWTTKQKFRLVMIPTVILCGVFAYQHDMLDALIACVFLAGMYTSAFLRHLGEALGLDMRDRP